MKDIKTTRGGRIVREMVAQGEHEKQDFKYSISDACKIARSLSAFANNGGGRLLIGVKDNGVIAGVRNEEDIFVVEQAAERYCRPAQTVDFKAYLVDGAVCVIVAEIEASVDRPVYVAESDGSLKAYYRVADENIAAHPLMVKAWERQSSPISSAFALDGKHSEVLNFVAREGVVPEIQTIARAVHISMSDTENVIVSLAAMGLLDFVYVGGGFAVKCHKTSNQ